MSYLPTGEIDRLVSAREAGHLMGGLHPKTVGSLVRSGRVAAKLQIARGRGGRPRIKILLSEVLRYIHELPDAGPTESRPRRSRRKLTGVVEFV